MQKSQMGSINAGLSVSMSVNKGAEGPWRGRSRWHIPVSSAQSFWCDLQHMSGHSPGRPNRITKGRLRSHQCTPVLALMCKRTMGQSMLLNQTVQGRVYCLIIAENLIIYSVKQYMRQTGEKAATGRGRTWKDKRAEGRMERERWNGEERKWEETRKRRYQRRCTAILSRLTVSRHRLCQQINKDITFHTTRCRCHSEKSLHLI